ncbi:Uncharacterized protein MSYG_2889 [Malassezia sympodialis ATCC 42132]|uniref:Redoxin domain-containing protein n=1 Tax=Malassezia sympodialis (strain ATCC 42132) TaxID=1230383 RepID=A0A1M8A7Y3_MALS4|nr:Uncharacterized protein MSYG_2889 [Malassezia sympodialis ATCC 42132]
MCADSTHAVEKDDAVFHLPGHPLPALVTLDSTDGTGVDLFMLSLRRPVLLNLFAMPVRDGQVDIRAAAQHESAQQLRAINAELDGLRQQMPDLAVLGLSLHGPECLRRVRDNLQLRFELLSDRHRAWTDRLELPLQPQDDGSMALRRCTMLLVEGQVSRLDFPLRQPTEVGRRAIELLRREMGAM